MSVSAGILNGLIPGELLFVVLVIIVLVVAWNLMN